MVILPRKMQGNPFASHSAASTQYKITEWDERVSVSVYAYAFLHTSVFYVCVCAYSFLHLCGVCVCEWGVHTYFCMCIPEYFCDVCVHVHSCMPLWYACVYISMCI